MNGNYLCDTNIVIAMLNNEPRVVSRASAAAGIYVSSIVNGELWFGALKSA